MPSLQQIQLANTFNEFRQAYNAVANTAESTDTQLQAFQTGLTTGTGTLYANNVQVSTLSNAESFQRIVFTGDPGSGNGAKLIDDADLRFFTANNTVRTTNLETTGNITATGTVAAGSLTSGRVTFAGASGLLSDDAELRYVTANNALVAANVTVDTQIKLSALTSGRVLIAGTGGAVSDDSGLTYNSSTDSLSASGNITATAWANAANMNITTNLIVGANVSAGDTVNAASHLHVGGVTQWLTAKQEDQDIHLVTAVSESDGAHDIAIVNRSNSANAYAEFIAINNAGNTETGWVSLGINATNYDQGAFAVTKGEDAYLLYQAPVGTTKNGDLVIGTGGNGTTNKIIFSANGFDDPANNTQLTIDPGNRIHIEVPTQSTSTTTGALTVAGGIGVVGNMNVGGNVTITGSISLLGAGNTVSTDTLSVANAMLFLANGNVSDTIDIGVIGEYTTGTKKYLGFVRDASDGIFKLFIDASAKPSNTVNFGLAGLNYGSAKVGELEASNTTATSSTTTGSLRVAGGAGIAGGVWAGGTIRTDSTTVSTSTSSGALIINGGAGVSGNVNSGGIIKTTDSTASTTTATGSIIAGGGLGVAGAINAGGAIKTTDSTQSTNTSTGSIITGGGIAAGGNINSAGQVVANNNVSGDYVARFTNINANGYGVKVRIGNNTNDALRISNATDTADNILMYGSGAASFAGIVTASNATASTSSTTGALIVSGGLGVAGAIYDGTGHSRRVTQNSQGGAYTLVASDLGKHISISTGGVTVPASIFSAGDVVTVYNNSASTQTITQGSGLTLRLAGTSTTGNRSLALRGVSTILFISSTEAVINGGGLT